MKEAICVSSPFTSSILGEDTMGRLWKYVKRLRSEIMSLMKVHSPDAWEEAQSLKGDELVDFLIRQPLVRHGICYHILGDAGYREDCYVQRLRDGEAFILKRCLIQFDEIGNPLIITLTGVKNEGETAERIGKIEEFISMETGYQILPSLIFDMLPED